MDVLVTANNHCVDRGRKGLERTIDMLDSVGIQHTGTFVDEASRLNDYPLVIYKNGFKLALLNYTYGTNGLPVYQPNKVNLIDTAQIRQDLKKAKEGNPDAVIVFMHWGAEYQSLPMKSQQAVAEFCFKNGARLVIGSHPHVIQPMRWKKDQNQLVAYSLGNFVSGQRKRYTDGGTMLRIELEKVWHAPDSAVTTIDRAGFILQWVYRTVDTKKDYYVLPVAAFENDSTGFIRDATSVTAFKTFVQDSRQLLEKHNVNVVEQNEKPANAHIRFRVLLRKNEKANGDDSFSFPSDVYEISRVRDEEGYEYVFSGDFTDERQAERYCKKLVAAGVAQAVVVKFEEGVMK